jgi:Pentapeptide repeats (8 copies)
MKPLVWGAQLQGADLWVAQLQGARLSAAQLQGASLKFAQLQAADLNFARLQGASLKFAQLQAASLAAAHLESAMLDNAQLQGAMLEYAQLQGASLASALLWRSQLKNSIFDSVFEARGKINWNPVELAPTDASPHETKPWTDEIYDELRKSIERAVPEGSLRTNALSLVAILDCARKDAEALASCDPSDPTPDAVTRWKEMIEAANIDHNTYAEALAKILGDLVCSDRTDRIYVLRGLLQSDQLQDDTGPELPALVKRITSTECPPSMALTDSDKSSLAAILDKREKSP